MNCRECRAEFEAGTTGRPRVYCSSACRQRAFRARRLAERSGAAIPGQLEVLSAQLRNNAEVIGFLARGWTAPQPGPTLAEVISATADVVERLQELGGRLTDVPPVHG